MTILFKRIEKKLRRLFTKGSMAAVLGLSSKLKRKVRNEGNSDDAQ